MATQDTYTRHSIDFTFNAIKITMKYSHIHTLLWSEYSCLQNWLETAITNTYLSILAVFMFLAKSNVMNMIGCVSASWI